MAEVCRRKHSVTYIVRQSFQQTYCYSKIIFERKHLFMLQYIFVTKSIFFVVQEKATRFPFQEYHSSPHLSITRILYEVVAFLIPNSYNRRASVDDIDDVMYLYGYVALFIGLTLYSWWIFFRALQHTI